MSIGAQSAAAVGQNVLELYYPGDDLGATYTPSSTSFRVFSPLACGVSVVVYESPDDTDGRETAMRPIGDGVWMAEAKGDLAGKAYTYRARHGSTVVEAADPYARALIANGRRSVVVDLDSTDPPGWKGDTRPPFDRATDAVIYELHVRDFSILPESGIPFGGKYLGLAARGALCDGQPTGLDHLVELGVTHVHLMPVQDFASIDEKDPSAYNWGYDPYHYFVPEGSYSLFPDSPTARITEFKRMVQALHRAGLRVVMDVVYNHTYTVADNPLNMMAPGYYYRTCAGGRLANGSGCGNEIATERPMARKLILDSLRYWVEEYHVDGFRFDLMALIDEHTMRQIAAELWALEPSLLIYGEPWAGGPSGLDPARMFTAGKQRGTGIAVFNDVFRNAVKGDNDGTVPGFVQGASGVESQVALGVVGGINYNSVLCGHAESPAETVNYVSCHDNLTLWDKMGKTCPEDSRLTRVRMAMLAHAMVLTSQGIPFMEGGAEMLRTKGGDCNSYRSGDAVNAFNWRRKAKYRHVFDYVKGLIRLRKEHPAFRMSSADQVRAALSFLRVEPGLVAFRIDGRIAGDTWDDIVVIYNARRHGVNVELPGMRRWEVVVGDQMAGTEPLDPAAFTVAGAEGSAVFVPALSAMVMHS
ncbi:MAG: type I pullulanase [Bacillota bacterium]|jgi:pullulanase|nr:type I pullulanase [Bacillota bacterium]